jgi:hypothetical protein
MRSSTRRTLAAVASLSSHSLLSAITPVSGQFDVTKTITLQGTVKRVD